MNLKKQRIWSVAIVGIVIFLALGSSDSGSSGSSSSTQSTPITSDQPTPSDPAESHAPDPELTWQYDESSDEMGRGKIRTAVVSSLNEVDFDFPYQGAQRAKLLLRRHPKYGRDVILQVEKGQFLTGIDG